MLDDNIQLQINSINNKLDLVLEEIALQRSHRLEIEDLKEDLYRVGNDMFKTAVEEFEGMSETLAPGDFWHLTKKLLRNVNNITMSFEQLESVKDFISDAGPVSRELFIDIMEKLDELDRKGYFKFFIEMKNTLDKVVSSFNQDDLKKLADNIVTILNTVKNLTQPEILNVVNNALTVYKNLDVKHVQKVTTMSLIRQINSPEMKKSLSLLLEMIKNITNQHYIN